MSGLKKFLDRVAYLAGSPGDFLRLCRATASNRAHRLTAGFGPRLVRCNLCGWEGRHFDYFLERHFVVRGSQCPGCGSQRRNRDLIDFIGREALPAGRVLDVAPAPGYRAWFEARGSDYMSIDYGERQAMARMDARRLAFADARFDLVILSHVLEHVPDFEAVLAEIRRVLKPSGAALIDVPRSDRPCSRRLDRPDHQGHWHDFGRDVAEAIAAPGFTVVTARYRGQEPDCLGDTFFVARPAPQGPQGPPGCKSAGNIVSQ